MKNKIEYDKGFQDGFFYAYSCLSEWMIFSEDIIKSNAISDILNKQAEIIDFITNHPNNTGGEKYLVRNIFSKFTFYYTLEDERQIAKDLVEKLEIDSEFVSEKDDFFVISDLRKNFDLFKKNLRICIRKKLEKNPLSLYYEFKQQEQ